MDHVPARSDDATYRVAREWTFGESEQHYHPPVRELGSP
jgi:hypothetical protein